MKTQAKNQKSSKPRSISTKVSLSIMAILVPLLFILIISSCLIASNSISKLNDKVLTLQTDYAVSIVNDFFNSKVSAVSMFDHNPVFQEYFLSVTAPADIEQYANKDAVTGQLLSAKNIVSQEKVEQVWLADTKTGYFLFADGRIVDAELDNAAWDDRVLSGQSTVVSEPVLDPATGKQTISIVSPVFSGSNVVGMVGFDVFLDNLSVTLSEIEVGENGYLELLSSDSNYIFSDDSTAMGKMYPSLTSQMTIKTM